jgi:hypothetical protein
MVAYLIERKVAQFLLELLVPYLAASVTLLKDVNTWSSSRAAVSENPARSRIYLMLSTSVRLSTAPRLHSAA